VASRVTLLASETTTAILRQTHSISAETSQTNADVGKLVEEIISLQLAQKDAESRLMSRYEQTNRNMVSFVESISQVVEKKLEGCQSFFSQELSSIQAKLLEQRNPEDAISFSQQPVSPQIPCKTFLKIINLMIPRLLIRHRPCTTWLNSPHNGCALVIRGTLHSSWNSESFLSPRRLGDHLQAVSLLAPRRPSSSNVAVEGSAIHGLGRHPPWLVGHDPREWASKRADSRQSFLFVRVLCGLG